MSHLLDVNLLLAIAWSSHADHERANRRLNAKREFRTAPVTQMGFLRVSLSLAEWLLQAGLRVWLDERNLLAAIH